MAETEEATERHNDNVCLFPGCDRLAVETRPRGPGRQGYKANYCELEEHNAASMQRALRESGEGMTLVETDAAADSA